MSFDSMVDALRSIKDRAGRSERAHEYASTLVTHRGTEPLGVLLNVSGFDKADVGSNCATTRARNVLTFLELAELGKLLRLAVPEIMDLRNCGLKTGMDILAAILLTAAEWGHPHEGSEALSSRGGNFARIVAKLRSTEASEMDAHATNWSRYLIGMNSERSLGDLLGLEQDPTLERDVATRCATEDGANLLIDQSLTTMAKLAGTSVRKLRDLPDVNLSVAEDILRAFLIAISEPRRSPRDLLEVWIAGLDERRRIILRHRLMRRDRTLDDLGDELGITRERVRQLEKQIYRQFTAWRDEPAVSEVFAGLNREIRGAVVEVTRLDLLAERVPALKETITITGNQVSDFITLVLPRFDIEGPWLALESVLDLRDETYRLAIDQAAGSGEALSALRERLGFLDPTWSEWLEYCGLREVHGVVVRKGASHAELALAVLRGAGQPLSGETIAERLGVDSVRTIRQRLQTDDRIVRVGPDSYGLPSWGFETYEGIREEIVQRIERAGGKVLLSEVVGELVDQFGVSPASVRAYSSGREFAVRDGWIGLTNGGAEASRSRRRQPSPAQTRRCFFHKEQWWFRIDIDGERLRGSGFPVPIGVMSLFHVAEGSERTLTAGEVEVRVSWAGMQPHVGSVRPLITELNANEGDVLWLAPTEHGELRVRLTRGWSRNPADEIALRTGVSRGLAGDELREAVSAALDRPKNASWEALFVVLRNRGDLDLADLVEEYAPSIARDVDAVPSVDDLFAALDVR